ncbi:MAG TPA: glycoside hydrolase family 5 protein [Oscillospiraceae bacterium]|nr:glycoside hydrolase family 5 protein [Oscillospiraceae bacterium]HXK76984.1 glycoside hydrolase family 5 protein [Oscillospiraceae bacterium]
MKWPVVLLSALLLVSLIFTVLARHESAKLKQSIEQLNAELDTCYETIKVLEDPGNGVAGHGALHVEGTQLTDEHGDPVQLRGMSTHGLTWYPQYTNANAMKTIAEYGGNVVRLAVYTDHYDDAGASDALYMALENALATDLYVIVDWHVLDDGDPNLSADSAEKFFTQIAERYADKPAVLYEICNEPNGDTDWEDVVLYAQRIIPLIREKSPNAVILVGTPVFCTDLSGPICAPLPYDNILYTYHQYTSSMDDSNFEELDQAREAGLPIFVSEWGITNGDSADSTDFERAGRFLDYLNAWKISWVNWSLSNKDETSAALRPTSDKLSEWNEDDLSVSGAFVFSRLSADPDDSRPG